MAELSECSDGTSLLPKPPREEVYFVMPRNSRPKNKGQSQKSWERRERGRTGGRARRSRERRLSVRGELRERPDVGKIARAVIAMALAQAEADAEASRLTEGTTKDVDGDTEASS